MRHFNIGDMTYNYDTGKVSKGDHHKTLRAKSNDVLLYLLKHPKRIISKQEILDNIWDDVAAQEHVLFQSIKEIRQCFAEIDVIKTHPRKGYEWIALVSPIENKEIINQPEKRRAFEQSSFLHTIKLPNNQWLIGATLILGAILLSWQILFKQDVSEHQKQHPKFIELVITPIKINPQDNLTQWVPIGAMDMLINKMQQTAIDRKSGGIFVVDTEDVLEAIKRADAKHIEDNELQSRELRHAMGEITSLHTELFGSVMEYSLKYSLISRNDVKQGVFTGENVVQIINQLARALPKLLDMSTTEPFLGYQQKFANDAFIFGLSHYYQNEMTIAEDYFRTAITSGDQFPQSRRYLAKSIAAQGHFDEAKSLALKAVEFARNSNNITEELRSLFELGANQWRTGEFALAKQNIEHTQTLAEQGKDLLYLAFAIEMLGQLALENNKLDEAQHYFSQALIYHEGFQCPYGRSSNIINLSQVAIKQSRIQEGNELLQDALNVAQQNELVYFETRIHLLIARAKLAQNNLDSTKLHLDLAQNLVDKYPNKEAEWVLKNWPNSATKVH